MARKLPWSAPEAHDNGKGQTKRTRSIVSPDNTANASRSENSEQTSRRSRKRAKSRSPSTSPIRPPSDPVPSIELMQEGLHADDRFIMVEDEFEAMARQFTAHLHAAEYARLKRKAKEAPPRALPSISSSMSRTTKQDLERRHLLSRQSTMLSAFGGHGEAAHGSRDDNSDDGDFNQGDKKVDNPWQGTSLAGLMDEGSQARTSLMGLERMNSMTRAARGYGRAETESAPKTKKQKQKQTSILDNFGELDRDDNEDDAITGTENASVQPIKPLSTKPTSPVKPHPGPTPKLHRLPPASTRQPSTARRSRIQDLDNFDPAKFEAPPPPPLSPSKALASVSATRKSDGKKDRKARLDEVPVFLA